VRPKGDDADDMLAWNHAIGEAIAVREVSLGVVSVERSR
jgi:hypothetical protein